MIFIRSSDEAYKTPYVSSPETQTRLCKSPHCFFSSPPPLQDHLLSPKLLSQHHLSCFAFPPQSPPFFVSHSESEALTNSNKEANNLDTSPRLNNGNLIWEPCYQCPLGSLRVASHPSIEKEAEKGREGGNAERMVGGLGLSYHSNGINGCVGFK